MAIAETAELIARLSLQDQLTGPLRGAVGGLATAEGQVGRTHGALGRLSTLTASAGGAFQHAAGRVKMLGGALGVVGLSGAIIGVTGFFKSAVGEALQFGNASEDMASTLGIARGEAQLLIGAFKQFGVEGDTAQKIVGMLLKNVGNLSLTADGASKFYEKFGLNIQTATGKIKDANTLIQDFTDYWNNETIPAEQRVAAGAALFGRNWQAMLEVLQSGSGSWREATQLAKDLGLANEDLTEQAEKNEAAMLRWNTVLDALKITIGSEVLPILTDLAEQATRFVRDNRSDITHFFRNLRDAAKDAVGFITGSVLPTIGGLASKANSFWNSVPAPLRDLLVKGFVADRTVKFLFGFSLADVGKNILGGAIEAIGKQFFMRGSTPANPLFVVDIAPGKGGVPGAPGAGGGAGALLAGLAGGTTLFAGIGAAIDQIGRLPTLIAGVQAAGNVQTVTDIKAALTQIFEGSTVAQPWRAFLPDFLNILGLNKPPDSRPLLGPPPPPGRLERGGYVGERAGIQQRSVQPVRVVNPPDPPPPFARFAADFSARWGALRDQLHAQYGQGAQLRRTLAEGLGISAGKLDRLHGVMRGQVARELGITVSELRAIKRQSDHNEELIAAKLGISVEQLRSIRERARETASGIVKLNNKDFSSNVTVKVETNITTRDVTRSVSMNARYGKYAT